MSGTSTWGMEEGEPSYARKYNTTFKETVLGWFVFTVFVAGLLNLFYIMPVLLYLSFK